VPSEVVVDKDDETLMLVFDEALGVRDGVLEIKTYVDGGATFKTVGNVRSELTALSNMSVSEETIDGDFKTVSFEESPLMSTYLVAVVVGFFDYIEKTTSDGNTHLYFSMSYTLLKLVMVVVPDFSGGTMENYRLITYREAELLHDDLHSAVENTQRLSIVVTHEVGQQWFGTWVQVMFAIFAATVRYALHLGVSCGCCRISV
ncbi:aminopeptidase M1-like protein isoform X1, partial [Tanacetum coccineum]